jgi:hypothetical protein
MPYRELTPGIRRFILDENQATESGIRKGKASKPVASEESI